MALTQADISMWEDLAGRGLVPPSPRVLEIGQANWFGDAEPPEDCRDACPFAVARKWYTKVLGYASILAIDLHGRDALCYDLNEPLPVSFDPFDIIINTGTAEHIFDQRQLLTTIHDCCAVGGLMVHAAPWQGWEDHGFYGYQPCFWCDLAKANDYEVLYAQTWSFGAAPGGHPNTMNYVALRRTHAGPFRVPRQGRYRAATGEREGAKSCA